PPTPTIPARSFAATFRSSHEAIPAKQRSSIWRFHSKFPGTSVHDEAKFVSGLDLQPLFGFRQGDMRSDPLIEDPVAHFSENLSPVQVKPVGGRRKRGDLESVDETQPVRSLLDERRKPWRFSRRGKELADPRQNLLPLGRVRHKDEEIESLFG